MACGDAHFFFYARSVLCWGGRSVGRSGGRVHKIMNLVLFFIMQNSFSSRWRNLSPHFFFCPNTPARCSRLLHAAMMPNTFENIRKYIFFCSYATICVCLVSIEKDVSKVKLNFYAKIVFGEPHFLLAPSPMGHPSVVTNIIKFTLPFFLFSIFNFYLFSLRAIRLGTTDAVMVVVKNMRI